MVCYRVGDKTAPLVWEEKGMRKGSADSLPVYLTSLWSIIGLSFASVRSCRFSFIVFFIFL